jgi:xanthine dehydrogenase accessory factor
MLCGGQVDVAIAVYSGAEESSAIEEALRRIDSGGSAEIPMRVAADGKTVVFRVRVAAAPKLVIVGGGHIGRLLAKMMVALDFRVTVLDDRSEFANQDRFPPPITAIAGDIAATLKKWAVDSNTYLVIVTRGHKHDEAALRSILTSPARYFGMIGSRRKIHVVFDDLRHEGASAEQLARVHAPIGLDIGAVSAEEIALSIAAELVSVRRGDKGSARAEPLVTSSVEP